MSILPLETELFHMVHVLNFSISCWLIGECSHWFIISLLTSISLSMCPIGLWKVPIVRYGSKTSALFILWKVYLSCPEVTCIVAGGSDFVVIVVCINASHFQLIRYQKHFWRASVPPVAFSFLSRSCTIDVVLWLFFFKSG